MKPAPFAYVRPSTIDDIIEHLGQEGAKILAGGQSLVPALAMRLSRPTVLVDIASVAALAKISTDDCVTSIGAGVTQRSVESSDVAKRIPLLKASISYVGHRETRSRGTMCGSLAHADPAAELPAVSLCLGATMTVIGPRGTRDVQARDFFLGPMTTAIEADEFLASVQLPTPAQDEGFGFGEFSRRHGDFALAGVACRVRLGAEMEATAAYFGVADRPVLIDLAPMLGEGLSQVGQARPPIEILRRELARRASDVAATVVETSGDVHAGQSYRRRLVCYLTAHELAAAYLDAFNAKGHER